MDLSSTEVAAAPATAGRSARPQRTGESYFARLAVLRFPLIFLVLCAHNSPVLQHLSPGSVLWWVANFFAEGLSGIRVPVFYLIAGFVFFRDHAPGVEWFRGKLVARASSVLLPLILWTAAWMLVLYLVQSSSIAEGQFRYGQSGWWRRVGDMSPPDFLLAFFGGQKQLFLYHLWFLRDLVILIASTPVILVLLRWSRGWLVAVLLAPWVVGFESGLLEQQAILFFVLGCQLGIARRSMFFFDSVHLPALASWFILWATGWNNVWLPLHNAWVLCGVVGALGVSRHLVGHAGTKRFLTAAAGYSFFVFVGQEPLLSIVRRLYVMVLGPGSELGWFIAYFACIGITIGLLVLAFKAGTRLAPATLQLFNGGRG